ncbi:MAG: hypothetical protein EA393_13410 [Bacteroidetes bacterium]|nr:MAG: hypothetical protein EA393_13410 [Bacteroidota bacterium]
MTTIVNNDFKIRETTGSIQNVAPLSNGIFLPNFELFCFIFSFVLFFPIKGYSQPEFFSGRVFDGDTQKPIELVNIVDYYDKRSGTTSDIEGFFKLQRDPNRSLKIHINSMGYKDTIIIIPKGMNEMVFFLQPAIYYLPEIVFSSTRLTERTIGSKNYNILNINDSFVGFPSSAGWSNGVFVTIPESKRSASIFLKSISFFVSDQGPLGSAFQVRLLKPKVCWEENKLEPFSSFEDLVHKRIIVRANQRGWNKIVLENLDLLLPRQPFVILFSPVYESEKYYWQTEEGGLKYGAALAFYQKQRIRNLFWVINTEGKLAYVSNKGPGSANPVIAISLNYLE